MSKETIKLYSHDGTLVKVAEFYKNDLPEIGWRLGWFKSYEDAKEDLEFQKRVKYLTYDDRRLKQLIENKLRDKDFVSKDYLVAKVNDLGVMLNKNISDIREDTDKALKESKRGQDLLLDRIKELESEISNKPTLRFASVINTLIGSFIGYILAIIIIALVN